jgi:LuxR family transcriptional regulator, maltose regulon positive regulatory protein
VVQATGELLRTKLVAPPPRPGALPRAALVDRLRAAASPGRLMLVVAGAGWGKSTLVATWARAERAAGAPVAWFSVDTTDDDPVRFWDGVVTALAHVAPGATERPRRLLGVPGTSTVDDVVPALVNDLVALDRPVTLVIDDYHLVAVPEVHIGVGLLLQQLPETLRLVLVSRTEPPLALDRLRGRGLLAELGPDDLRLSPVETADLLTAETAARGIAWTPAEVDRVHTRTEGWLAGLHLAVLSRRTHPGSPAVSVRGAPRDDELGHGGAPHLAAYLRSEVLDPLPGALRSFLRHTAVLDRFSADLARAVTGRDDAAVLLAEVERAQLFLVPLDDRGEWFRYHHLFADVLHDDLVRADAALVPRLHARAARWHARHGTGVVAVRHALGADDPVLAADLVAAHAPVLTRLGQVETALGWFRALGDEVCAADPRLATARALAGAHTGRPQDITRWADAAAHALDTAGLAPGATFAVRVEIAMLRWAGAVFAGNAEAGLRHAEQADRLLADRPQGRSGFLLLALGVSQYRAGRLAESSRTLADAESVGDDRGEHLAVVAARGLRALQAVLLGRPGEATQLAAGAEAVADRHGLGEHFNTATLRAAQGLVAMHDGHPRRAVDLLRRALELVRRGGLTVEVAELLAALAVAESRLGRHVVAARHLAEARNVLDAAPDPGHLLADPRTTVLGPPARPDEAPLPVDLSARQTEILRLLADDLTSAEIADRLRLSRRTVEAHLRALYRRLDVRSRAAATRYAVEHGMTTSTATRPRKAPPGAPTGDH